MSKWVCSECRHSNNSHAKYCIKCGQFKEQKIVPQSKVMWLCPVCKTENHDSAKYCRKCGHWLLGETYTPTKVEKTTKKVVPQRVAPKTTSGLSKLAILEVVLQLLLGCLMFVGGMDIIEILPMFIFIHLIFSVFYIVLSFSRNDLSKGLGSLVKHGALILVAIVILGIATVDSEPIETASSANDVAKIITNAVELQYEDLLRNAEGKYKGTYVKIIGEVYHLENGDQQHLMVNMSRDPLKSEAVYIDRKENNMTVIIDDKIVIYGKVIGTIPAVTALGTQSAVPAIESYSMSLYKGY